MKNMTDLPTDVIMHINELMYGDDAYRQRIINKSAVMHNIKWLRVQYMLHDFIEYSDRAVPSGVYEYLQQFNNTTDEYVMAGHLQLNGNFYDEYTRIRKYRQM